MCNEIASTLEETSVWTRMSFSSRPCCYFEPNLSKMSTDWQTQIFSPESSWEKNLQSFLNEKQNDSYVCWKWWSISEKSPLLQKFDSELIIWVCDSDNFIEKLDLYYCWSLSTFCEWRKFICDVNGPMTHSVQKGSQ